MRKLICAVFLLVLISVMMPMVSAQCTPYFDPIARMILCAPITSTTTATNLSGGTAGQFPYQTGVGATGFRTPNAANGPVVLDANGNTGIGSTLLGKYTVGTPGAGQTALPAASSYPSTLAEVVDCETTSACSTGGGTVASWLRSDGSAWSLYAGGGGGTPGGSNTQIQYNNSGAFGGIAATTGGGTAVLEITESSPADGDAAVRSGGKYVNARPALTPGPRSPITGATDTLTCPTAPTGDNGAVNDYLHAGGTVITVPAAGGACPVGTVIWIANRNASDTLSLSGGLTATIPSGSACRLRVDPNTAWTYNCMFLTSGGGGLSVHSVIPADPITGDQISAAGVFTSTLTIPSASLTVGATIHVIAAGVGTTTATSSPLFNMGVKLTSVGGATGAVQVCTQQGQTGPPTGRTSLPWSLDCWINITSTGTGGKVRGSGNNYYFSSGSGVLVSGLLTNLTAGDPDATIDTTVNETVSIVEVATLVSGQTFSLQKLLVIY